MPAPPLIEPIACDGEIGQGKTEPHRQQHGHGLRRGLAERKAQRGRHERRGAGRRHHDRQHAGEERARDTAARGQRLAHAGEAAADLEGAGEIESDHEEQIGDQQREDRRLELEAPAHLADAGADRDHHRGHRAERDQHAGGVGQPVAPQRAALAPGQPRERRRLHRQHRKHTRHQIEDQPAQ